MVPHGHSTPDQGLCSNPRTGASLATGELYSSLPRTCFKAMKQDSELFSRLSSYRGKGPTLSWFLGLAVTLGPPSALSTRSRGLRWLACFLVGLAFPLAQPQCAHCLREENAHTARPENGSMVLPAVHTLDCVDLQTEKPTCFSPGRERKLFLSAVLLNHCCITNERLKTTIHIYYLVLSLRVRNLVWLGSSGPGSPTRLSWDVSQACSHLKAWLGLGAPLLRWCTHMADKFVLAVGRRPQCLSVGPSPQLLTQSQDMETDFPQGRWFKKLKWKLKWHLCVALEATHCHLHYLYTKTSCDSLWEENTWGYEFKKVRIPGRRLRGWLYQGPTIC